MLYSSSQISHMRLCTTLHLCIISQALLGSRHWSMSLLETKVKSIIPLTECFFSSRCRSGRMCMQLMQQYVKKSSSTTFPASSLFKDRGPSVFSHSKPGANHRVENDAVISLIMFSHSAGKMLYSAHHCAGISVCVGRPDTAFMLFCKKLMDQSKWLESTHSFKSATKLINPINLFCRYGLCMFCSYFYS